MIYFIASCKMWMNWLVWTARKQIACSIKVLLMQRIMIQKLRQPVQISPGIEICFLTVAVISQVIFLIGNKCDLDAQRDVTYEEAKQFAEENGASFLCLLCRGIGHGLSVGLRLLSERSKTWDEATYLIMWIWTNKYVTGSVSFMCTGTISLIHGGKAGTDVFRGS